MRPAPERCEALRQGELRRTPQAARAGLTAPRASPFAGGPPAQLGQGGILPIRLDCLGELRECGLEGPQRGSSPLLGRTLLTRDEFEPIPSKKLVKKSRLRGSCWSRLAVVVRMRSLSRIGVESEARKQQASSIGDFCTGRAPVGVQLVDDQMESVRSGWPGASQCRVRWKICFRRSA